MFRKAEDGISALESGSLAPPDVVLMDISLAGVMSGLQAGSLITDRYKSALVFLTGQSHVETFEEAFKSRPVAFLLKPFDVQQALVSIRLAVYQKQLENRLLQQHNDLELAVSERTRQLESAQEKTREAIRVKKTMLSQISSQIREPMYGILGISSMLRQASEGQPQLQKLAQYIDDNSRHLLSLLNKISALSDEFDG